MGRTSQREIFNACYLFHKSCDNNSSKTRFAMNRFLMARFTRRPPLYRSFPISSSLFNAYHTLGHTASFVFVTSLCPLGPPKAALQSLPFPFLQCQDTVFPTLCRAVPRFSVALPTFLKNKKGHGTVVGTV